MIALASVNPTSKPWFLPVSLALLLAASVLSAQTASPEAAAPRIGKRFWEGAVDTMSSVLSRLNNYTCIVHMSRFEKARRDPAPRQLDSIRLQVTALSGLEYYALPGSPKSVTDPRELVRTGLVATGMFQGYAHAIFMRRGLEKLEFLGSEGAGERSLLHFRFVMEPVTEALEIRLGGRHANAAAKGDFWIDERDLRLRRVIIENVKPLVNIGVQQALYVMDWAPVKTRAGDFLLPQRAEVSMLLANGEYSRNESTLAQCREYRAESSIRFDVDEDQAVAAADSFDAGAITASKFLPGGLRLELRLSDELRLDQMTVGDEFHATLSSLVSYRGKTLLPKGAQVLGRIRRLDAYPLPQPHSVAWLEFSVLRDGSTEYTFLAEIEKRDPLPSLVEKLKAAGVANKDIAVPDRSLDGDDITYQAVPGVASFIFEEGFPSIPAGYRIDWKTIPASR